MSESKDVVIGLRLVGDEIDLEHTSGVRRTKGGFA